MVNDQKVLNGLQDSQALSSFGAGWFDLSGRKLDKREIGRPGFFIVNGKKRVVR